jgi:ATP-dependent exoDNAse (exonuclease V) alpha subunit
VERIVGVFPQGDQPGIRMRLAKAFQYIVSQRLLPRGDGLGRVALLEILKSTLRTREYVEQGESNGKTLLDAMKDKVTVHEGPWVTNILLTFNVERKPFDEFDFGYVLTVHKAQGSQWDDVVLFDESFAFQDSRARWLYTGITRAAKRLSIVV